MYLFSLTLKVKGLLKIYPFKHKEADIDILDGKYEGVYSWLTLNYALGDLLVYQCNLTLFLAVEKSN